MKMAVNVLLAVEVYDPMILSGKLHPRTARIQEPLCLGLLNFDDYFYASMTTRKLPRFLETRQDVEEPDRSNSRSNNVDPTRRFCNDR